MAEDESVGMAEEVLEELIEEVEEAVVPPAPEPVEKPWLLGQTPSMWFLIDSAVVLLIVILMRVAA